MNSWKPRSHSRIVRHRHVVDEAVGHRVDDHDLLLDRHRLVLPLLEHFDRARAAIELPLRRGVEVRRERGERFELAVLREVEAETAGDRLIALICAEPPTRDTEIPALIAGRTPAKNRSDSRKIWPSVIEMTFVGM